jgi:ParB-like chromosome segregation protein Spo0J
MTSFKQKIQDKEIKRADAMKVRWQDLHEEPGFNLRDENAVDENGETFQQSVERLADYIARGGQYPALEVRPRAEGGVWIVDGHRRRRAIGLCIERGVPLQDKDGDVWVSIVPFEGNDADRTVRILTSREGRELAPLETARGYARLRGFGWDNSRIAVSVQKTPTHVGQLLLLADANSDVQNMVASGEVAATLAVQVVRAHGEEAGSVLADAAATARAQGKKKVTAGTLNGKPLPRGVVDEVEGALKWFMDELSTDTRVQLANAEKAQDPETPIIVTAGMLLELTKAAGMIADARKQQAAKAREKANRDAQTDIEG